MFVIKTTPVGAKAITSLETSQSKRITHKQRKAAASDENSDLEFSYLFCEPTPCGIEMPRKSEFDVLITKKGFVPRLVSIGNIHRKKIPKETGKNTAIAAGVVGVGTAVGVGVIATDLAATGLVLSSSVVGASLAAGAIIATPVVVIGLASKGVDASTGANYDLTPNPLILELGENSEETSAAQDAKLIKDFHENRTHTSLNPPKELSFKERKAARLKANRLKWQERKAAKLAKKKPEYPANE